MTWEHHGASWTLFAARASRAGRVLLIADAESANVDSRLSSLGPVFRSDGVFTSFAYPDRAEKFCSRTLVTRPKLTIGAALGGLAAFTEQPTSFPGWEESEAQAILLGLQRACVRQLPDFNDQATFTYRLPES